MRTNVKYLLLPLAFSMVTTACRKDADDPATPGAPPVNEEELITTVRLSLVSSGGTQQRELLFRDTDGEGGNAPVIEADTLSADSTYTVTIHILNESATPVGDITAEIVAEGADHQLFFHFAGVSVATTYTDADANGAPIGLASTWVAGAAGTGTVTVTLRHEPLKDAPGVSMGDITNAQGETDIEVTLPLVIQ